MKKNIIAKHEKYPDPHHDIYSKTLMGFWMYLLTDFILFGTLFATYAVLHNSTFGGLSSKDLFYPSSALDQTIILLLCAFTVGLGCSSAHRKQKNQTLAFFGITFVLGVVFFVLQMNELSRIIQMTGGWRSSAFLSAYFTLMGTFAVHMLFALLWIPVLAFPLWKEGLNDVSIRRLTCLKMFWQFLNIIWVFIFSFVYLLGVL